jgi:hypothetical protein
VAWPVLVVGRKREGEEKGNRVVYVFTQVCLFPCG